ncbi:MAG: DUF58 domain-containing protein [Planctomycetota bacterium]
MAPTGLGAKALLFYIALCTAFYAAPYMNLFFLLLVHLGGLGLLTAWWTWSNVAGVSGQLDAPEPVPADVEAPIKLRLEPGRRKRRLMTCHVAVGSRQARVAAVPTLRHTSELAGRLPALPRGVHTAPRAWLASTHPFGAFRARRRLRAPGEIVVYPTPIELSAARTRAELLHQMSGDRLAAGGEDRGPAGLREHRPGDDLRNVHWKATARRGGLVVREWDDDTRLGIEVCLDLRARAEELEHGLSQLAGLALWAREHKEVLQVQSQDHTGTYGEGHRPWAALLRYLALAQPIADDQPPPATSPSTLRLPQIALAP